jgi:hypothetical protein
MPVTAREAKAICTKPEYELYDASRRGNVEEFTPARLKQKVQRARRLRDKWRDESKRQRREKRGKAAPRSNRPAQSRDNTVKKAELFGEVLERFQKRLKVLEGKAEKEQKKKQKKSPAKKAPTMQAAAKKPAPKRLKRIGVAAKRSGVPKGVRTPKAKAESEPEIESQAEAAAEANPESESDGKVNQPKPARRAKRKAASKKARIDTGGAQRHLGHVSSRNRRNQSRRDFRG